MARPNRRSNVIFLVALAALFLGAAPGSLHAQDIVPNENLVQDGIPKLPASIASRAAAYSDARSATLLSWHPGKRAMLIATRFADVPQIHRVAFPGGARQQLTFFPDRILGAAYPPVAARADHFVFSKDIGGGEFYQLFRYDEADGKITLLTDGKSRNSMGPFSADGTLLAYTSTRRNGKDSDLFVMDPRTPGSERRVAEVDGGGWEPLDISRDGKRLLVLESISINESYLWVFDVASGARTALTPRGGEVAAYAGGAFSPDGKTIFTTTDRGSEFMGLGRMAVGSGKIARLTDGIPWDVEAFTLSRDGRTLAFVVNEDGRGVLHLMDARTGKETQVPRLPPGSVAGLSLHPNGRDLGFVLVGARAPADVYALDLRTRKVDRFTESEVGPVDAKSFAEPELVRFPSFDGRSISGYLYRPAARFSGKRPVIISIHGGPESQYRPIFLARNNYWLSELGVALLFPNVRGSSGYGKTFLKLDNAEKREDSVKDIGALLDYIKTRPELDADRVMVMGGSYGGYMSYAVSAHYADRLRASISVVGISNFVTFLERTESYRRDLRRVEYGDERDPKLRPILLAISPTENVAKIKKPIFVVQGKNDPRVPLAEAEQMVARLKKQGTPVWYLMARDEGHGFAKKRNADFQFFATVAFVEKFLLAP